jgi:hypothetical protein
MQLCILLHARILSSPSGDRVWPRLRATGRRPTCHHWLGASRLQRFKHRASRDVLCGLGYATLALAHRSRLGHLVTLRLRLIGLTPIGSALCDSTLCCSRPRGQSKAARRTESPPYQPWARQPSKHFMRSSLNRRVHFMRSSLNRRVHFMRSRLTRLLQATLVVLWLDGDGAYLPPVPAAARPQPDSASHQRFRPLRAPPILLVMLFRSLRAPPVSPPCIPMQLHFGRALARWRRRLPAARSCGGAPSACFRFTSAVQATSGAADPSGHALQVTSGAACVTTLHTYAAAVVPARPWPVPIDGRALALGLFRSLVVLFRSLRAPPVSPPCISRPNAAAVVPARPWPVPISGRALQATSGAADQPPVSPPCISRPNAAAVVPVLSNSHAPWRSSLPQLWPDTSCRRASRPSRVSFGISSGSSG